jgi:hypothetical protein
MPHAVTSVQGAKACSPNPAAKPGPGCGRPADAAASAAPRIRPRHRHEHGTTRPAAGPVPPAGRAWRRRCGSGTAPPPVGRRVPAGARPIRAAPARPATARSWCAGCPGQNSPASAAGRDCGAAR